jgi:hypothetical protein
MVKILVRRRIEREVFLFETIESLLFLVDKDIDDLLKVEPPRGWKEKVVLSFLLTAMLNEGWINAIGSKVVDCWVEKKPAEYKIDEITKRLLPELDKDVRPLSSVHSARAIRNEYAHAKPFVENTEREGWEEQNLELEGFFSGLTHPVEESITINLYRIVREDSAQFRDMLLKASGLKRWDIKTRVHEDSHVLGRDATES